MRKCSYTFQSTVLVSCAKDTLYPPIELFFLDIIPWKFSIRYNKFWWLHPSKVMVKKKNNSISNLVYFQYPAHFFPKIYSTFFFVEPLFPHFVLGCPRKLVNG